MCILAYIHTYKDTHTHTYIQIHLHTITQTNDNVYIHTRIHQHTPIRTHSNVCLCVVWIYVYVLVCVRICVRMFVFLNICLLACEYAYTMYNLPCIPTRIPCILSKPSPAPELETALILYGVPWSPYIKCTVRRTVYTVRYTLYTYNRHTILLYYKCHIKVHTFIMIYRINQCSIYYTGLFYIS